MASFAKLNPNNQVVDIIIVNDDDLKDNNGVPAEGIGVGFLQKTYGADTIWKQSPKGNIAGIGMTYITNVATLGVASTDVFIGGTKPYPSWSIGINTASSIRRRIFFVMWCSTHAQLSHRLMIAWYGQRK